MAFFEKDEKLKAEKMKKVGEETIPNNLVRRQANVVNYFYDCSLGKP